MYISTKYTNTTTIMKKMNRLLSLVLALVLVLSCVDLSIFAQAAASDYISTSYASSLSVKTKKTTELKSEPNNSASAKYTLPADIMLTVQALHKNTSGTYYYEVRFYNMTLYVKAADCTMVDHLTGDITIKNVLSPASLAIGDSFAIKGDITSTRNLIGKVTAGMYLNQNLSLAPTVSASTTVNGKSFSLYGSAVDSGLNFGNASAGVYDYAVTVEAISYYIDGNGALATSTCNVVVERQQCVITDWRNPNKSTAFGIDVSVWQGYIDWSKVRNDVDFVILRIGFSETLDNRFLEYAKGCETYGIPYGVYHYSYALSESAAIAEANFVLKTLDNYGYNPKLGVWFDMEDGTQASLSTSLKEAICRGFCDTIRNAGRDPGFYGWTSWFSSSFQRNYLNSIPIWIAQIDGFSSNGTATHDGGTWLWQYSWEGSISGIGGDVDCNMCYANWPGIDTSTDTPSDKTYLAQCTEYPAHFNGKISGSVNMRQYPSTSYSSVTTLSAGTSVEVTGLYKNSSGGYWYQINYNGTNGYVDAGYVTPVTYLYDDIAIIAPTMTGNLNVGASYNLAGEMVSKYNNIYAASAKVYSGEDTQASPVLTSSDNCNSKSYNLRKSTVDSKLLFGNLGAGYYTYELSADVRNYYISGGTLKYQTENVVVWTAPFTVGNAAITPPANLVCNHIIITDPAVAPGCTTTGKTAGTRCSKCGIVITAQETVPATGHKYTYKVTAGNCNTYDRYTFTCSGCGINTSYTANQMTSQWIELPVTDLNSNLFTTQTQYRYSDYQTTTSYSSSMDGYTLKGSQWVQSGTGSVTYVSKWADGFSKTSSVYTQYNKTPVTASETATTKTEVTSNERVGWLWYHWCDTTKTSSWAYETDPYHTFHTYYGTTDPSNYQVDTFDYSYKTSHSSCSNATYWFPLEVYTQNYTNYKKQFTYERWGDFSAWSTTPVSATATRKVETRTVFKLKSASLSSHSYVNGKCSICGTADPNYVATTPDYYLFGFINGANYACEEDYANLGSYKFVNGKLTVVFESDSFVAVKNGNNLDYYMTNGWLGNNATTATLYLTDVLTTADKLFIPGGKEVTFTLKVNTNGTLTLSYTAADPVATPTVTPKSPSLTFKDEVTIDVHFAATDLGNLTGADLGLLTWSSARSDGTVADAEANVLGAIYNSATGRYLISTKGIPAKKLGDTVYMKLYVKMANGNYVYSKLFSYSPKTYATNQLKNSSDVKVKRLMVAMLNYGAAAQTYFAYKPYSLANNGLTADQKALVSNYSTSMVPGASSVSSSKIGIFTNSGGFSSKRPAVSFGSAFSIEYFFTPAYTPSGNMTLYYWTQADYNAVSTLKSSNASGRIQMTKQVDGSYHATISGIAAKDINQTIYVAGGYKSGTTNHCTGVLPYSIGTYCASQVSKATTAKDLAAATAVYGYYANAYFNG